MKVTKLPPTNGTGTPPSCAPQCELMDDFIERTLKERRALQDALADLLAKYNRLPPNSRTSEFARMIEGLKAEIALRNRAVRNDR